MHMGRPVGVPLRPLRAAIEAAVFRAQAVVVLLAVGALVDRAIGWKPWQTARAAAPGLRVLRGWHCDATMAGEDMPAMDVEPTA